MAVSRNVPRMFELLLEAMSMTVFENEERLTSILSEVCADLQGSITQSGHSYAMSFASASLDPISVHAPSSDSRPTRLTHLPPTLVLCSALVTTGTASHKSSSCRSLLTLRSSKASSSRSRYTHAYTHASTSLPLAPSSQPTRVQQIAAHVLQQGLIRSSVVSEPRDIDMVQRAARQFMSNFTVARPIDGKALANVPLEPQPPTFFPLPATVNYVAKCVPSVGVFHADSPALQVLAKIMSQSFLHKEIREKGGAYGGGASSGNNVFSFYSYRDPHLARTLATYQECVQWARSGAFTQQNIEEAMLSIFSNIDAPVPPSRRGKELFSGGITHEMRQRYDLVATARARVCTHVADSSMAWLVDGSDAETSCSTSSVTIWCVWHSST